MVEREPKDGEAPETGDAAEPGHLPGPGSAGATAGSGRGLVGCLGCAGVVFLAFVVLPLLAAGSIWLALPTLVAPAEAEWATVEPDPDRGGALARRLQGSMERLEAEGAATVELDEAELNLLLARALRERLGPRDASAESQLRLRLEGGLLWVDGRAEIPRDAAGVPGRLQGQEAGLHVGLRPRVDGDAIALAFDGVRVGRIPLPVGLGIALLGRMTRALELGAVNPDTREIRIPLDRLEGLDDRIRLEGIRVGDGRLALDLAR